MKQCKACGEWFPNTNEYFELKHKILKNGEPKSYLLNKCRRCNYLFFYHGSLNKKKRCWSSKSWKGHINKGYDIDFTAQNLFDHIIDIHNCNYCDLELIWLNRKISIGTSATLDRVNNENAISLDTIQILCRDCNRSKFNRSHLDYILYSNLVLSNRGKFVIPNFNIKKILSLDSYQLTKVRQAIRQHRLGTKKLNYINKCQINISDEEIFFKVNYTTHCKYCGKPLIWSPDIPAWSVPSLDRKDNENFLNYDNTQFICNLCNTTKSTKTEEQFYNHLQHIVDKFGHEVGLR